MRIKAPYSKIKSCRVCKSKMLKLVHDFGIVPLADKLIKEEGDLVESAQLSLSFCQNCYLLQINENVSPELLFKIDYPYLSSDIPEVEKHFKNLYKSVVQQYAINQKHFLIEIAGNDGVLLKNFKGDTSNVLNIEPSLSPAKKSESKEIKTIKKFFSPLLAEEIVEKWKRYPSFIFASNVLAHVPKTLDFVKGLKILSDKKTIIIVEVPHALPMIKNNSFDVVFHQHFSYFNLHSLNLLFRSNDLFINKIEKIDTQGGSLRLFISQNDIKQDHSVAEILIEEEKAKIYQLQTIMNFSNSIEKLKNSLNTLLVELNLQNKKIIGYGAPGKAATLLNYFGISNKNFEYLVDISPSKQGKIFPFTNLKIFPVTKLLQDPPDYIVILAWNYSESIIKSLKKYAELNKVKFISIYPSVEIS